MDVAELQEVKIAYHGLTEYFQRPLSDRTLKAYADDLSDLPCVDVLHAMQQLRRQAGRRTLPMPADVRAACTSGNGLDIASQAVDIAGKITDGIRRFGYTNVAAARAHIGEVGWAVMERQGGWVHVCNTLTADRADTFRAQCREMAKSLLLMGSESSLPALLDAPSPKRRKSTMTSIGALMPALAH